MKEMDEYYFLKATLTVPTKILLTSKQITDNMKKNNFREYFDINTTNGIITFQEINIKQHLDRQYNIR